MIIDNISRTFSEYLILPRLTEKKHSVLNTSLATPLTTFKSGDSPRLTMNIPVVSAAMQAVSGPKLAITLARQGGLSFIYCSQPISEQAEMIASVKAFKAGFVTSDSNVKPNSTLKQLTEVMKKTGHSTVAVTADGSGQGLFEGIITDKDFWEYEDDLSSLVKDFMTPVEKVIHGQYGITLHEANRLLRKHKKECLPILTKDGKLHSLVFKKDYIDHIKNPNELLDDKKRLLVGAAVNTHDYKERVPALVEAGVDVLCFDSSDGFSEYQKEGILWVKEKYGDQIVVGGGNIVSAEGFDYLARECKADFIKIGIGGGSICITREQKGIGRGQASAVLDVAKARDHYYEESGVYVPLCSDGALVNDTQLIIVLAMGADFVMMGRYFAMTDESPNSKLSINGKLYKPYWGEGSYRARNWQRYSDSKSKMLFEEGVDAYVPAIGPLAEVLNITLQKIRSTMVNTGASNLAEFRKQTILTLVSQQSFQEGGTQNVLTHAFNPSESASDN